MKPNDKAYEADAVREVKSILNAISLITDNKTIAQNIVGKIIAAYAAQFPSSEDYAGLLKMLRSMHKQITSAIKQDDPWGIIDETVPSKAADALEVVLAERDRLNGVIQSYQILLETQQGMLVDTQTERDALAARLAPVEDKELVEIVAKEFIEATTDIPPRTTYTISERSLAGARAAIAAIRPHIEAAERERIANQTENWSRNPAFQLLAAAIRSGK